MCLIPFFVSLTAVIAPFPVIMESTRLSERGKKMALIGMVILSVLCFFLLVGITAADVLCSDYIKGLVGIITVSSATFAVVLPF